MDTKCIHLHQQNPCTHTHTHTCTHTHPPMRLQTKQAGSADKHTGRLAGRQGRQMYAYTDSDTDTCTVCQCTDRQTHRLAGRQSRKTDVCIHWQWYRHMHCLSVHRRTNTQAGWQAGKEDGRIHTLIVILIQTHALLVSAQTDKHTGGLAGRQGRQTYAYSNTDSETDTWITHTCLRYSPCLLCGRCLQHLLVVCKKCGQAISPSYTRVTVPFSFNLNVWWDASGSTVHYMTSHNAQKER